MAFLKNKIKPFLTSKQSSILFFLTLFLIILKDEVPFGTFLLGLDSLNIFLRLFMNDAEPSSIKKIFPKK